MKLKINYKTTASIMVSAILAVIVWIGIAQSMAMVANSSFKSIKSGRTALQAQQYADISIDRLKNINYDELDINGAHSRKKIEGISSNDWQDEVTIGAESTIGGSDDAKQRIATVNVYKVGDTMPRYTVEVPLSSQGSNILPLGTILPYIGDLSKIPHGWFLCDGTNNTPDLRNRFLEGATEPEIFIEAGLPNIIGTWGDAELSNDNSWGFASGAFIRRWYSFGHDSGNGDGAGCYYIDFDASRCSNVYGNSYTVQPASYTVYYIMRVK